MTNADVEKHLTPAEMRTYKDAEQNLRHHRAKARQEQAEIRRLKNLARKRRDTSK